MLKKLKKIYFNWCEIKKCYFWNYFCLMAFKLNIMKKIIGILGLFLSVWLTSCEPIEAPTPTKTLMRGNWELIEATDSTGDITRKIAFPITVMQLSDDDAITGTIGPMFTRIVYGPSKWIEAMAKFDQVWDYANFQFNNGDYWVGKDVQQRFTVEARLKATTSIGGTAFTDLLSILGVNSQWFDHTIYHKFQDVKIDFSENNNVMTWTFDDQTVGIYNKKDSNGNYVLWRGWPVEKFLRSKYVFRKRTQGITELVRNAR